MPQSHYDRDPRYDEPPTKMEMLVDLVSKSAKSDSLGTVHPISVRVPTIPFVTIQALAKHSGMSMNKVIVSLLDAALDEMWKQLSEEDQTEISNLRHDFLAPIVFAMDSQAQSSPGEV